jgi:hypothetical protein
MKIFSMVGATVCSMLLIACSESTQPKAVAAGSALHSIGVPEPSLRQVVNHAVASSEAQLQEYLLAIGRLIENPEERQLTLKTLRDSTFSYSSYNNIAVAEKIQSINGLRRLDQAAAMMQASRTHALTFPAVVTLAFGDQPAGSDRAVLVRPAGLDGRAIILLRRDATAGDVGLALHALWEVRERMGDYVPQPQRIGVRGKPFPLAPGVAQKYSTYIERLNQGPTATIAGITVQQAYTFRLGHIRHSRKTTGP